MPNIIEVFCTICEKKYKVIVNDNMKADGVDLAYTNTDENYSYFSNMVHHCCPTCVMTHKN